MTKITMYEWCRKYANNSFYVSRVYAKIVKRIFEYNLATFNKPKDKNKYNRKEEGVKNPAFLRFACFLVFIHY